MSQPHLPLPKCIWCVQNFGPVRYGCRMCSSTTVICSKQCLFAHLKAEHEIVHIMPDMYLYYQNGFVKDFE